MDKIISIESNSLLPVPVAWQEEIIHLQCLWFPKAFNNTRCALNKSINFWPSVKCSLLLIWQQVLHAQHTFDNNRPPVKKVIVTNLTTSVTHPLNNSQVSMSCHLCTVSSEKTTMMETTIDNYWQIFKCGGGWYVTIWRGL